MSFSIPAFTLVYQLATWLSLYFICLRIPNFFCKDINFQEVYSFGDFRIGLMVFVCTCSLNSKELHLSSSKPMVLVYLAFIATNTGPVKFIGWVAPSCICIGIFFGSIINQLQCSVLHVKRAMNRVPIGMIS